jgi:hypothetical protein
MIARLCIGALAGCGVLFPLAPLALLATACGHETIELGTPLTDGGAPPVSTALPPGPGDGAACEASAACVALGGACSGNGDCCTERCVAGACLPSGACVAPAGACTARADCCSGDCEPGASGALACTTTCLPDGTASACQRASDCCGRNCNSGTCGGAECVREGEDCTTSAQCCSGTCDPQQLKCTLSAAAACRPAGEDCSSGGKAPCCGVCDSTTRRCDIGAGPCRLPSALCTGTSDCCTGTCAADASGNLVCGGALLTNGATCQASFACESGACVGNPPRCNVAGSSGCSAAP